MKLTYNIIKEITFGAVRFFEEDGFLFPKRCTQAQEETWGKYIPDSGKYSKMTTGVRLDFYTNSSFIRFCYPTKDTRAYSSMKADDYELLVNGIFVAQTDKSGTFEYNLPSGENRVSIYFPISAYGAISDLELEDGATCTPYTYKRKFMFFGDSITQGFTSSYSHLTYAAQISQYFDADFLNQAVGCGDFFPATFDNSVEFTPDYVFIAFGTNDYNHFGSLDTLRKRGNDFLDLVQAKYPSATVIGISPLWRGDAQNKRAMGTFEQCCETVKELHKARGFYLLEGEALTPHEPSFYADEISLHPTTLGFGVYASNIIKRISNIIK